MTNAKRFPADEAIHHTGQRGPMVVLASDHDAETDRLQRHLDSRNEQIDGYERQLGIDKAGAEHTIGSEIERLTRERDLSRAAIEQLHAAVKTAQELAATRLMEIGRLSKREKNLMDVIDSRDRALGFVPLDEVHASEPLLQRCDFVGMYDVRCGLSTGHEGAHRIYGPHGPAASRDADHCDYPDCEQHWTHVVAQARALLEPLAECDPAIRQWLKTPDLPKLQGASRDASSVEVIDLRNVDFQPPF